MMKNLPQTIVALAVLLIPTLSASAADWPQFRGPGSAGISGETDLPINWSAEKNVVWKKALRSCDRTATSTASARRETRRRSRRA